VISTAHLQGVLKEFQVARTFNVNIVDLVEAGAEGQQVPVFDSKSALDSYTTRTKKYFPRKHAFAGGLLSYLL
jgi:hypothetical protein